MTSEEEVPADLPSPASLQAQTTGGDPEGTPEQTDPELSAQQRKVLGWTIAAIVLLVVLFIAFAVILLLPSTDTAKIRDVFIIFMAVQSMLIGLALIVLMVQLARLINLLQNDIKPILDSTNETVSTLRGTVIFLGDNLAEPVLKLNEALAALSRLRRLLRLK